MKITTKKIDNVTEVLTKVLEFTDRRARLLHKNILNVTNKSYRPADLDAAAFADIMGNALSEHLISDRLLLIDSENIKFGPDGHFEATEVIDQQAGQLLKNDSKEYLKTQMKKISENQMNQKVAAHLIERKKQKTKLISK
jgi:flagellar basal body rod protein FlgB